MHVYFVQVLWGEVGLKCSKLELDLGGSPWPPAMAQVPGRSPCFLILECGRPWTSSWIQNPGAHRREKRTLLISGPCRLLIHWPGTGGWEDTKICVSPLWLSGCKNALQVQACIGKNVRKEADRLPSSTLLGSVYWDWKPFWPKGLWLCPAPYTSVLNSPLWK